MSVFKVLITDDFLYNEIGDSFLQAPLTPMSQSNGHFAKIPALDGRWEGISRPYTDKDVERLRGTVLIEHTLAKLGAEKFWKLLHTEEYIPALGALSGNQVRCVLSASDCT